MNNPEKISNNDCFDIIAVIVTFARRNSLKDSLNAVKSQNFPLRKILVVDNEASSLTERLVKLFGCEYVEGNNNFGGAGGYELGISKALDYKPDAIWLLDDDGYPEVNCLSVLVEAMRTNNLLISTPLCISTENTKETSNPYIIGINKVTNVNKIKRKCIRKNKIQFFNGALIFTDVFAKVGLPNKNLFIRGDELDYYYRVRAQSIPNALITSALYFHPSSSSEYPNKRNSRFGVVIPQNQLKKYYQFRNQGYLVRRHKLFLRFFIDWTKYGFYFLVYPGKNISGFREWSKLWIAGFKLKTFDVNLNQSNDPC